MATVVDTLVTKYVLDTQPYKQGADSVIRATLGMGNVMTSALAVAKGLSLALVGAGGIGATVVGVGVAAAKSAADWDVLVRQLAVVTGSFERANKIAKFAQDLAVPSAFFDTEQLAGAARLLETLSLQTERYLPLAATMASLFGADTTSLMEFTSALGRLKAGQFGEAFEALRRYGISAQLLQGQGLQFDKGGQFTGSADQALAAVENIVKTRFGKMDEIMGSSHMAKFTTVLDNIKASMKDVGQVILDVFSPAVEKIGLVAQYLRDSDTLAKTLKATFAKGDWSSLGDGLVRGAAAIIATFKQLPNIVDNVKKGFTGVVEPLKVAFAVLNGILAGMFTSQLIQVILGVAKAVSAVVLSLQAAGTAAAVFDVLVNNWAAIGTAIAVGVAFTTAAKASYDALGKALDDAGAIASKMTGIDPKQWNKDFKGVLDAVDNASKPGAKPSDVAKPAEDDKPAGVKGVQTQYLARIAANTDKMVDFQRSTIGGSAYGERAFNSVNIGRATRGASVRHGHRVASAMDALVEALTAAGQQQGMVADQRL